MTRLMGDSVNPWAVPTSVDLAGGYVDCSFVWSAAGWARFAGKPLVRIAAGCNPQDAQVCDVERGDYMPWEAPDFAVLQRAKGIVPTCYVNLSNWNPTRTEFALRGISEPLWWLADYDGLAELPAGAVAKQYANSAMTGGNYDLSIVADYWPGVDSTFGAGGGSIADVATLDIIEAQMQNLGNVLNGTNPQLGVKMPDGRVVPIVDALALLVAEVGAPVVKGGVADLLLTELAAMKTELDAIQAGSGGAGAPVDLSGVTSRLDRLLAELHTP